MHKDFFSCPLVDEPDPQEKMLLVYQSKEIEKYLASEKEKRRLYDRINRKMQMQDKLKQAYNQKHQKMSEEQGMRFLKKNLSVETASEDCTEDMLKIAVQMVEKSEARLSFNAKKIKAIKRKKPMYKNEEI